MVALDALTPEDIAVRLAAPAAERAPFLRAAAEQGHAEAQLVYGQMLLDGAGVAPDAVAALGWFTRAAGQHHAMALNMVGRCYDQGLGTGVDKGRAAACFRVAAELGLSEAMYNYATLLALGDGVAENKPAALALFERAAARGYAKAINHVGSFAEDGWVHPRDMAKATDCYRRAAEGGDFRGQFNHARMLIAAGDIDAALPWLAAAGAAGNAAFVVKAIAWLRATGDARLAEEGVATVRDGC